MIVTHSMTLSTEVINLLKKIKKLLKSQAKTMEERKWLAPYLQKIKDQIHNTSANELSPQILILVRILREKYQSQTDLKIALDEIYYTDKGNQAQLTLAISRSFITYYAESINFQASSDELVEAIKKYNYWVKKSVEIAVKNKKELSDSDIFAQGQMALSSFLRYNSEIQSDTASAVELFKLLRHKGLKLGADALLAYDRKKYQLAIDILDKLLAYTKKYTELVSKQEGKLANIKYPFNIYYHYGLCYKNLGNNKEALRCFLESEEQEDILNAKYQAGVIKERLHDYEGAALYYKVAATLGIPEAGFSYYLLSKSGKIPNLDEAMGFDYLLLATKGGHPEALFTLGQLYERQKKFKDALSCYKTAEKLDYMPATLRLAVLYTTNKNLKNLELAKKYYEVAAKADIPEAHMHIAEASWYGRKKFALDKEKALTHYAAAESLYKKIIETCQEEKLLANASYNLAKIYSSACFYNSKLAEKYGKKAKELKHPLAHVLLLNLTKGRKTELKAPEKTPANEMEDEGDEPIIATSEKPKEKTIYDLMNDAYKAEQEPDFAKALEIWLLIKENDDDLLLQVQVSYAIANCYLRWKSLNTAPGFATQCAQEELESALNLIICGLTNENLQPFEQSDLESWKHFIFELIKKYQLPINYDEFVESEMEIRDSKAVRFEVTPGIQSQDFSIDVTPGVEFINRTTDSALLVGGAVLDSRLGIKPRDYDMIAEGEWSVLETRFKTKRVGTEYPIILVNHEKETIQLGPYQNLYMDFLNRDFTINALYYNINQKRVFSYYPALDDLQNKIIRTVINPKESITDCPFRILRAIRLAAKTHFTFDPALEAVMSSPENHKKLLAENPDRLFSEILRLFINANNAKHIHYLNKLGLLKILFPQCHEQLIDSPKYLRTMLLEAATQRSDKRSINPALVIATLLFSMVRTHLRYHPTNEQIENVMLRTLTTLSFPIPINIQTQVRSIWRYYLMMKNRYQADFLKGTKNYSNYVLAERFFYYMEGRFFSLRPQHARLNNEVALVILKGSENLMLHAIKTGNLAVVRNILKNYDCSTFTTDCGGSLLHVAASSGHADVVTAILRVKCLLHRFDANQQSPLHYAAAKGHTEVVLTLIAAESNVAAADKSKCTALHYAALHGYYEIAKALLAKDPRIVNLIDANKDTALHLAIRNGHRAVAELLVQYNADVSLANNEKKTAIEMTLENRDYVDLLPTLINASKAPISVKGKNIPTAILKQCNIMKLKDLDEDLQIKFRILPSNVMYRLREDHTSFFSRLPNSAVNVISKVLSSKKKNSL